jgi:uncharacterized protein with von Willebrand factor type A (vWA) domain
VLYPLKFAAANIFLAGVTAGTIGGAATVIILSDAKRRDHVRYCADKMRNNCKTKFNIKPTRDNF